jgi:hypothetical protein
MKEFLPSQALGLFVPQWLERGRMPVKSRSTLKMFKLI